MHEPALKQAVARLARRRDEDIEAVLRELEPGHRTRLRAMLAEETGRASHPASPPPAAEEAAMPDLGLFSPWLSARIGAAMAGNGSGRFNGVPFSLAPAAREALAAEAASLPKMNGPEARQPKLFRRLLAPFRRMES